MTIETGALEQGYAKVEASYNVVPADALAGSDGIRILQLALTGKMNREPSPEKRGTPDRSQSLPRRQTAGWNLSSIMWEPSGTLGTISNVGKFLKAGMGSNHVLSLDTTVEANPAPTTTGCTLTSAAGVAPGDLAVFNVGSGATLHREVTKVATVVGAAITFDALSAAPAVPGKATVGITYSFSNTLTESLAIYKYYNAGNFKEAVYGCVVDKMVINIDGTKEVLLSLSGPGARYGTGVGGATVQAKPLTHVTVGAPLGGMVGNFYVGGTAFLVSGLKATVDNQAVLRNKELGVAYASGIAGRSGAREVGLEITCFLEDTNLIAKAQAVTKGELRCIVGDTNGSMLLLVAPSVEFEIPEIPAGDNGPKEITIQGVGYAVSGNDALVLGEA
jgi:hypothetical protein